MTSSVEILASWRTQRAQLCTLGKLSSLGGLSGLFALRSTKTFYLIQGAPRESNGLIWPKSAASSVYPLVGIKKKLIQQTQEQMPTGKKAQRMCWLHFCLLFLFSYLVSLFVAPKRCIWESQISKDAPQRFDFVHFKHFLSQTTKGIGKSAWRQIQTGIQAMP